MQKEIIPNHFSLNDFPDELLLIVMSHLNDTGLLNMTRTCTRFRDIAKEAFGKKYSGPGCYYEIFKILCENDVNDQLRYRPFLCTFGGDMKAIEITFDDFDEVSKKHWIYDSLPKYCTCLTYLNIHNGDLVDLTRILRQQPSLTHLQMNYSNYLNNSWTGYSFPNLKSFELIDCGQPNQLRNLDEFFDKNRQLTELSIENDGVNDLSNIIDAMNGKLHSLKALCLNSEPDTVQIFQSRVLRMDKLESVILGSSFSSYAVLAAISQGCQNIKKLEISCESSYGDWNDAIPLICSLKKLAELKVSVRNIRIEQLQRIFGGLPNLTRLHLSGVSYTSNAFERLPYIITPCTALIEVKVDVVERDNSVCLSNEFIKSMADLTRLNSHLKVVLQSCQDKWIFAHGELRLGNSIIYFDESDHTNGQSKLSLLDLGNDCLEKIVGLLHPVRQCALYNSCTQMQKVVKDYIWNHQFHTTVEMNETVLRTLGPHISRISVENWYLYDNLTHWTNINRYCCAITELIIMGKTWKLGSNTDNQTRIIWPSVTKLIIEVVSKIDYQNLRLFVCPNLRHLEIRQMEPDGDDAVQETVRFDHGDEYRQLTVLKFGCYNSAVAKFLSGLDDTICQQIKILSLDNISDEQWRQAFGEFRKQKQINSQLINILTRFGNLDTLEMLVPGIADLNTQYVFENCTKLIHIAICHSSEDHVFDHLMQNCKQIQSIRVIGPRHSTGLHFTNLQYARRLFPTAKIQFEFNGNLNF